jgi:PAS domain S-box-containing protein
MWWFESIQSGVRRVSGSAIALGSRGWRSVFSRFLASARLAARERNANRDRNTFFSTPAGLFTVALIYYCGAKIGIFLKPAQQAPSTFWPVNALLMAILLLVPARRWGAILLAALPAHLLVQMNSGVPTVMSVCWFISNSFEALVGAFCLRRFGGYPTRFNTLEHVAIFIGWGAFFAPFVSSFLDAAFVSLNAWKADGYWTVWRMRLLPNVLAVLTLVPLVVMLNRRGLRRLVETCGHRLAETTAIAVGLFLASFAAFESYRLPAELVPILVYGPLPFLLWTALRFGHTALSAALLATTLIAVTGTQHGAGPFGQSPHVQHIASLQVFLIALSVPLTLLAAIIQERKQTAKVLGENRNRLKAIFDASLDSIFLVDDSGRYVDANASACKLIGFSRGELLRKTIHDVVVLPEPDDLSLLWQEFLSEGSRIGRYALRRRDRQPVDVECYGVAGIQPHLHLFVVRDLSERKRAEEAVARTEKFYRDVVEAQTELICRYLPDTTLTFVNDAYCRFFEKSREELIGCSVMGLYPERSGAVERIGELARAPRAVTVEHEVERPSGEKHWIQWKVSPRLDASGGLIEVQAIGRDVTERRHVEELLRISHQCISALAVRLINAHEEERKHIARELHDDFNQRLAAHAIAIDNLMHQHPNPDTRVSEKLRKLRDEAVVLGDEIRMISHEIRPPALEESGLADALRSLCEKFSELTRLHVDLYVERNEIAIPPDTALCCYRIVQEGLRNIHKHARASKAEVSLAQLPRRIVLMVADDGAGFSGHGHAAEGGIGLTTMEERVKLLGGEFHINNRPQGGTILVAELPVL